MPRSRGALEAQRATLGWTHLDCWAAYYALGGSEGPVVVGGYLAGRNPLPPGQIEVLAAALDDATRDDSPTAGISSAELHASLQRIVDRTDDPGPPPSRRLVALHDAPVLVRAGDATTVEPLGGLEGDGAVLRVDDASSPDWEIHNRGNELLVLLTGAVEVRTEGEVVSLSRPRDQIVIPPGLWHRHHARAERTALLYLTPASDTLRRDRPPPWQAV